MAENDKSVAESVKEVMEATAPDAPKKNAVAAETSPLSNSAEDLGAAVVKPTDSNPDATKKVKEVSGQAPQKSEGAPDPMPTLKKEGAKETEKDSEDKEIKEGEMPAGLKKYLDKKDDAKKESTEDDKEKEKVNASYKKEDADAEKKDEKAEEKEDKKEIDVKEHVDALVAGDDSLSEELLQFKTTLDAVTLEERFKGGLGTVFWILD